MRAAGGGPPERCPDLVATFKRHEPTLLAVEHPRATIREAQPWWDARNGHSGRGMVVGLGGEPMPCLDLAPSILSLMGAPAKA